MSAAFSSCDNSGRFWGIWQHARTLFRMTPEEALAGVTRNATRALGLADRGILASNLRADFAIWDVDHPAELAYRIGFNPLYKRVFGGEF